MQERGYDFSDRDRIRRDFDDRNMGRNERVNRGDRDLDRWGDQSDQSMYSGRSYDRDDDARNFGGYGSSLGSQRFTPFDRDRGYRDFDRDDRQRSRQQSMGPHAGRGPKGYQRSDERIKEDVCDCLSRDPQLDASEIEVQVKDGEVTLTGTVSERSEKRRAEDAIDDVSGVKEIHNQIRVQAQHQDAAERNTQGQAQQGKQKTQF